MKSYSVYFSAQGRGWYPVEIPHGLQNCNYDSLVNWAAKEVSLQKLKGFLVSENPNPFMLLKRFAKKQDKNALEPLGVEMAGEIYEKVAV